MWECPDFFELDGKHVLLTSPQDMLPEGLEYHNGNGTLCIIGEMDQDKYTLKSSLRSLWIMELIFMQCRRWEPRMAGEL